MNQTQHYPPKYALVFFRWYCNPHFKEEIEGDLLESYHNNIEQYGLKKANRLFIKEVLFLFRPSLIANIYQPSTSNSTIMSAQNKRLLLILALAPTLLLIPLVAMQFSTEVNWSLFDFLLMGALLLSVGLLCELILRKVKTTKNRLLLCAAVLFIFLLIWAELAVGIFGTPLAGN